MYLHPRLRDSALTCAAVLLIASLAMPLGAEDPAPPARIAILFGPQRSYRAAAFALKASLERKGHRCIRVELARKNDKASREQVLKTLIAPDIGLIATAGNHATTFALEKTNKTPIVFFHVPNAPDAPFMRADRPTHPGRLSGVTIDVQPEAQLEWIKKLCPRVKAVAILHSRRTERTVEAFRRASEKSGIRVIAINADKGRFPEAIDALNASGCDGVLMIPDAKVYNAATIKRLLLWGLRKKIPVLTFSENVVKAGAAAGMYADSGAAIRQTSALIHDIVGGADPAAIALQYPKRIQKSVNLHTIQAIGAGLDLGVVRATTTKFGERQ